MERTSPQSSQAPPRPLCHEEIAYVTDHPFSQEVCSAFAKGANLEVRHTRDYSGGPAVVYGILRGCGHIIERCIQDKNDFIHIDHGYFGRGDYYRVTRNGFQQKQILDRDSRRWKWELEPWRKAGTSIALVPPSDFWCNFRAIDKDFWIRSRTEVLAGKLNVTVSDKNSDIDGPIYTKNSLMAVGAVLKGYPSYMEDGCIDRIIDFEPWDRTPWVDSLSYSQWTLAEMESGQCWEQLNA